MMALSPVILVFVAAAFSSVSAQIPSYIKVCNRNDPNLSQCIIDAIDRLRPRLKEGIPELDVPSIEPLPLNEIRLNSGPSQARISANISNLLVYGPSTFKTLALKPNLNVTRFLVRFVIPTLYFEGDYEIDMNILFLKYKGKGPINGNFTNYVFDCTLKGDKVSRNSRTYLQFRKFNLTLHQGKSSLHLANLFGDSGAAVGAASNDLIRDNSDVLIDEIKPALERSLAEKLTVIANKITNRYTYDELFPDGV